MSNDTKFIKKEFLKVRHGILEKLNAEKVSSQNKNHCFTSANLSNFLEEVSTSEQEKIYENVLLTQAMLVLESRHISIYEKLNQVNQYDFDALKENSKIFCTFHVGSYRSIIGVFAQMGLDFVLIVDETTFQNQKDTITELVVKIQQSSGVSGFFEVINAERIDIGIVLSKYLEKNVNVIAYIDGNTGIGGIYNRNLNLLKVRFFKKEILVRKGIPYLSFFSNKCIVPVVSYYNDFDNAPPSIEFLEEINPKTFCINSKEYVQKAAQHLWDVLEKYVSKYPDQWEGWLYIHKYLDLEHAKIFGEDIHEDIERNKTIRLSAKFDVFIISEEFFLFNRRNYAVVKISENLFYLIHSLKNGVYCSDDFFEKYESQLSLIHNLLNKEVLEYIK